MRALPFATKLPASLEPYIQVADANPARDSVRRDGVIDELKSFSAWAYKLSALVQKRLTAVRHFVIAPEVATPWML